MGLVVKLEIREAGLFQEDGTTQYVLLEIINKLVGTQRMDNDSVENCFDRGKGPGAICEMRR